MPLFRRWAVFMLATAVVFGSIAWGSGVLAERFRSSSRIQVVLNRVAGFVFAGLAVKLITAER